jgi:enoyl-CoA hydratase
MDLVRSEGRGGVTLWTLDRPDALNALSSAMLEAIAARAAEVAADRDARAVVITGEGRAFAAGADIEEMRAFSSDQALAFSRLGHRVCAAIEALPVPVIAAVNGFALGGGCELALACDWIYASEKARFGQPEVNLGVIPGFGGTSRLPRRVGVGWARELVLSGAAISADDARSIGLVNRVFAPEALLDAAIEAAETVAAKGPLAVARARSVLLEGQDVDPRAAHALEQHAFAAVFATEDRAEGMAAFVEKRDPKFRGC